MRVLKTTLAALLLAASFLGTTSAPAAAAAPCWKQLLNDYYDGRIDNTYPVHCYREAVNHLQEDVSIYGSAGDDINRALLAAIAKIKKNGGTIGPNTPIPGGGGGPGSASGSKGKHNEGFLTRLLSGIGPKNADSIPIPLLILAGLALLLIAAAGASFVARRMQARRAQPAPANGTPPRPRK